jgi:hypothetical protein
MVKIVRGNACRKQITEAPCLKVTYEGHEFYVATKEELSTFFACLPLNRYATARRKSELAGHDEYVPLLDFLFPPRLDAR